MHIKDVDQYRGPSDSIIDQLRFADVLMSFVAQTQPVASMDTQDNSNKDDDDDEEEEVEEAAEVDELMGKAPLVDHGDDMDMDENKATPGGKSTEYIFPHHSQSWALIEGEGARSMADLSLTSATSE